MRHLITPMDLSVEETMNILDLAERISLDHNYISMLPMADSLLHFFTNQVPEPVYLSSLLC